MMKFLCLGLLKILTQFCSSGHRGTRSCTVKTARWFLAASSGPFLNLLSIPMDYYFCSRILFSWTVYSTLSFKLSSIPLLPRSLSRFSKEQSIFFLYESTYSFIIRINLYLSPSPSPTHTSTHCNETLRRQVLVLAHCGPHQTVVL